jgi:hypothetical protein
MIPDANIFYINTAVPPEESAKNIRNVSLHILKTIQYGLI